MKVVLIQTTLAWEDAAANRANFSEKINAVNEAVDLIILPEMFTTGFTMNPSAVAENMDGQTVAWMKQTAVNKGCAITGSLVIEEDGKYYNRLLFVLPNGEVKTYDKRHLFSFAGEDKHYTAGSDKLIVEYKGWKICPLVCYDLRFPVFSRNTEDYDLLLYVANWPEVRTFAWDALLQARAIENLSYTIGVNRVGLDANENNYNGHTQVLDALGGYIIEPQETDGVFVVELSKESLGKTRAKFAFLNDMDRFNIL